MPGIYFAFPPRARNICGDSPNKLAPAVGSLPPLSGLYTGFLPRAANLEYVEKRGGEAVSSCRAAAGVWVYLQIQGGRE